MRNNKQVRVVDVFLEIALPFLGIIFFFWFALWDFGSLTWDYRMYKALLVAVFFNFFLRKSMKIKNENGDGKLDLYVVLWEIAVPLVVIVLVILSLIIENKFYSWTVLVTSFREVNFYVLLVMVFLLLYFVCKGFEIVKK